MIAGIVAVAHNNVIGKKNDLPWYLPADLRRFRDITLNHVVIMGRKTCDSIIARLGHGLPGRTNIVITQDTSYRPDGISVVHSLDEALRMVDSTDAFVIGGEQIYALALPYIDRLYITEVDADIDGDTYFPSLDVLQWRTVSREEHTKDERNVYDYAYVVLDRIS